MTVNAYGYTEEEAREKICPRVLNNPNSNFEHLPKCGGALCMWWVWVNSGAGKLGECAATNIIRQIKRI